MSGGTLLRTTKSQPRFPLSFSDGKPIDISDKRCHAGLFIVNADDWGQDLATTERTYECILRGGISSVSAMVFMQDSERAAAVARERGIDTGLHLNFTTPFSAIRSPTRLKAHQQRICQYLRRHRLAQVLCHPGLANYFGYVVAAQLEEFGRLYGVEPRRIDGHHHMHLCANVLLGGLLPRGTIVRRNLSFQPGEKGIANRLCRRLIDGFLARRYFLTDFFFSLMPLNPSSRLRRIISLARRHIVEVEAHPINLAEYSFLAGGEIIREAGDIPIASSFGCHRLAI